MTKRELSKLMGTRNAAIASMKLYERLEKRRWRDENGRVFHCSGLSTETRKKEGMYLQLSYIASVEPGVACYRIIRVSLDVAIDCLSGQLSREDYTIAV